MYKILFLSALDFKERSIQVILKTPEAYVVSGWSVRYIVARDTTRRGNYFYENEVDPQGVRVSRFSWPFSGLRDQAKGRWALYFWSRLAGIVVIFQIAWYAARELRREPADVIYGYEVHGVLALKLLRLFGRIGRAKTVTRFQGTWLTEILEKRQIARILANLDQIIALRTRCDLMIMTNDGSRGDAAVDKLRSPAAGRLKFWVNGTDIPENLFTREAFRKQLGIGETTTVLLSVSRLVNWKHVDRGLSIAAVLRRYNADFAYIIIGDGEQRKNLEKLASELGVAGHVTFVGAVPQPDVFNYMNCAEFFISMYDLSNVGNPLLEALRMEKIVVTLNNGDTRSWIKHMETGLIYDLSDGVAEDAGRDIARLIKDPLAYERLRKGVHSIASKKLWTWQERMTEEVKHVEYLLK